VSVDLFSGRSERLAPGAEFTTDRGDTVRVATCRLHGDRHLVRFDGVPDRSAAEALRGRTLWAAPLDDPDTLWVHDLVGATVVTVDGRDIGTVAAVEANPASDLLVLDGGALVPLRFVTEHRPGDTVTVDIPEGLLDV